MVLKDISTIYDCPHSTAPDEGEGYALIRTPNIGKGRLLLDNVHRVSKEVYDKRNKRAVPQEGDIIFAREAPAGNAAVITKGQEVCLGQRTVLIKPNQSVCNSEFLVYYLLAPEQQIKLLGFSHGATVQHVNIAELSKLPLILPPLATQQKIASILSTYDTLIENNTKRIHLLEQMAENLYKEWFVRFRFPGYEKEEMENGLPKGWKEENLFDIANVSYGYAFKSNLFCEDNSQNPVVRIRDIQDNATNTYTSEDCPEKYLIEENAILIGMDGLFHMCLWNGDKAYLNQRVVKLNTTSEYFCNYFLYMSIRPQVKFWEQVISGTTVAHLGDKHLKKMKVIVPTDDILRKANTIINDIMIEKNKLFKQNKFLVQQRDLLLPRLMSGKLEVKS